VQDGELIFDDLITAVGSTKVHQVEDLFSTMKVKAPGDHVELTIWRGCDPPKLERVMVRLMMREQLLQP
jgi:PDZ domain-containing secreted protein